MRPFPHQVVHRYRPCLRRLPGRSVPLALSLMAGLFATTTPSQGQVQCGKIRSPNLVLEETIPIALPLPPRAIALTEATGPTLVDASGRLHYAESNRSLPPFPDTLVLQGVSRFGETVIAYSDRMLFALRPDLSAWDKLPLSSPLFAIRTVLFDSDEDVLWVVSGERGGQILRVRVDRITGMAKVEVRWGAPGTWRIATNGKGGVTLLAAHRPFTVVTFRADGTRARLKGLNIASLLPKEDSLTAVFASSIMRIECDAYLTSFADIRSNKRWVIVFRGDPVEIMAGAAVASTMGFFQYSPETQRLFAYHSTREGGRGARV